MAKQLLVPATPCPYNARFCCRPCSGAMDLAYLFFSFRLVLDGSCLVFGLLDGGLVRGYAGQQKVWVPEMGLPIFRSLFKISVFRRGNFFWFWVG